MSIKTVKKQGDGYLVNGDIFVPNDGANRQYQEVQSFIKNGGIVEDEFSPQEIVAKIVSDKKVEIDTAYRDALNAGVTYKAAVFQSDEKSVQSLVKVLTALANSWVLPAGFVWIDAANVAHSATKAWLQGLNKAFGDHEAALFTRKLQAKGALAAIDLTSPTAIADIQAIAW